MSILPERLSASCLCFCLCFTFLICGCDNKEDGTPSKTNSSDVESDSSDTNVTTDSSSTEVSESGVVMIEGELSLVDWDSMIDKEVMIKGDLVIVDTYDLARRGQVKVSRARLYVPTNMVDPNDADPEQTSFEGGSNVKAVSGFQKNNDEAVLMLDDGSDEQNVFPPKLFPELGESHPSVRIGSVIHGVRGVIKKERNKLALIPSEKLDWNPAERPERPEVGQADLKIASFNVLNYFSTIDDGNNRARGADSASEKQRQLSKIVSAIIALDADVIGLMELENNLEAEEQLVTALNEQAGSEIYQGCGLPNGFRDAPGSDNAIRVGLIYRKDKVDPADDVSMISDAAFELARTPLVQTFTSKTGGTPVTVIVNHFKSKGGSNRAEGADKNNGDGQGAYNATRTGQALAICNYIEGLKKTGDDPRVLVMGDLNAYAEEDPIDALRAKGLVDLKAKISSENNDPHYSYIYYGQSGSLDHAMATEALADDVTGVAIWHINADEPRFLDYNEEYNPKSLYQADPFRSSDHDPVLIGIKR